jgi:hypothetical protein
MRCRKNTVLLLFLLICGGSVFCWIFYVGPANSGPYLDSAHGNSSYGVKRNAMGFPSDYTRGLCAHCHEQHASIDGFEPEPSTGDGAGPDKYELFKRLFTNQSNTVCYDCHKSGSIQVSMPLQYNYSRMAGGDTNSCPDRIREAFQFVDDSGNPSLNCSSSAGSSHFLDDIRTFLSSQNWEFGSSVENIDPCSGCHNPHMAQRDSHISGDRGWTVSRPSQHSTDNNVWGLWGDNIPVATERMSNYAMTAGGLYQAPCRYPFSTSCTSFEPDGSLTSDGSNLFDTVSFCLDCHSQEIQGSTGGVAAINWGANGDVHGGAPPQTCCDKGDKRPPYSDGVNYVLSCLDCHEPHGSPNEYLLRQEVNGNPVPIPNFDPHLYYNFCRACHRNLNTKHTGHIPDPDASTDCKGCHSHGVNNYPKPLGCEACPGTGVKTF